MKTRSGGTLNPRECSEIRPRKDRLWSCKPIRCSRFFGGRLLQEGVMSKLQKPLPAKTSPKWLLTVTPWWWAGRCIVSSIPPLSHRLHPGLWRYFGGPCTLGTFISQDMLDRELCALLSHSPGRTVPSRVSAVSLQDSWRKGTLCAMPREIPANSGFIVYAIYANPGHCFAGRCAEISKRRPQRCSCMVMSCLGDYAYV